MPHQMEQDKNDAPEITHYEILGLPAPSVARQELPAQQLKAAYRRALLQHHPDKARADVETTCPAPVNPVLKIFTIDQISGAYAVLSVPKLRSEYDRDLLLKSTSLTSGVQQNTQPFRPGIESMDLDDMDYDEKDEVWYKSCRCGDDRGFMLLEADLEEAAEDCELHVGCRGCSLWLRDCCKLLLSEKESS